MTDEVHWVARTLEGDDEAFARLLRPYRQGMMRLAFRMTGSREAAEEICQEAMIKVFKYLPRFQVRRNFRSWLFKITANAALDFLRRARREESIIAAQKATGELAMPSAEKCLQDREIAHRVQACLDHLTPKERMVFLLRDMEGFSVKETAALLRSSSMAVRTHLSRARSKIRMRYGGIRTRLDGGIP